MPTARLSRAILWTLLIAAMLMPTAGCGGTKKKGRKGGLTVKEQLTRAEKETNPDRSAAAYLRVARSQMVAGDKTGAKDSARMAFDKLSGDGDAGLFAQRLLEVAACYVEMGDKKLARDAVKRSVELAGKVEDPVRKTKVLADAGGFSGDKLKGLGDATAAKEMLAAAAAAAEAVEPRFQAEALAAVALGYARGGLAEAASEMVGKLEQAAKAIEEPRAKAEALAAAANVKAQGGKADEAKELLSQAAAAAKSVERSESRAYALLAVATASAAAGDTKAAVALLKEADKAADKVPEGDTKKTIVERVRAMQSTLEKKK
jgi:tetratricopeptide (TPR) repeat protein